MNVVNDVSQWSVCKGASVNNWVGEICGAVIAIAFIYFFSRTYDR